MFIESITVKNFRNYKNCKLKLSKKINFFLGDNGTGKSNLLEAISLCSHLKSFRSSSDAELIKWGESNYFLELFFKTNNLKKNIKIACVKKGLGFTKKVTVSGDRIAKFSDIVGHFICVVFSPADMDIVDGGPVKRRRFIDLILSQKNPLYLQYLLDYNKILKHRNALLKKIKDRENTPHDLVPWDLQLEKFGEFLIKERKNFIEEIQILFTSKIEELSGKKENWSISYSPSVEADMLKQALENSTSRDIFSGRTNKGPHLDKILFRVSGLEESNKNFDATQIASQGQKRTMVLALKLLQYEYLKNHLHINPVLLIDDVITELDKNRRYRFIKILKNMGQSFFTTTSLDGFQEYIKDWKEETEFIFVKDII